MGFKVDHHHHQSINLLLLELLLLLTTTTTTTTIDYNNKQQQMGVLLLHFCYSSSCLHQQSMTPQLPTLSIQMASFYSPLSRIQWVCGMDNVCLGDFFRMDPNGDKLLGWTYDKSHMHAKKLVSSSLSLSLSLSLSFLSF
jgi:hypothetical protein